MLRAFPECGVLMSGFVYQASVATYQHALRVLESVLRKGEARALEAGFPPENLLHARLAPDMHPLLRQVQIACDLMKSGAARIAGVEIPSHADDETSFEQLYARIDKVQEFLKSIDANAVEQGADRTIEFAVRDRKMEFGGMDFLNRWSLPNLYFHLGMVYALLRHNGVALGKRDFLYP